MAETSEKTRGELVIGKINPTDTVEQVNLKLHAIDFINMIDVYGKDQRRNSIAITEIEQATMMAVKSAGVK